MKKIIIAASLLATCLMANAQEPTVTTAPEGKQYKPVAKDVLVELGLFGGGLTGGDIFNAPESTFGTPQIKVRYFMKDDLAIRIGFNISQFATNTKVYEASPGTGEGFFKEANHIWGINGGIEKHFKGTGRLSTYVGADGSVQFSGASSKSENVDFATNSVYTNGNAQKVWGTNSNGVSSFGIGGRVVTGADYYFVDKVYLGAEIGWGFMGIKESKIKTETTTGGVTTDTETKSAGGSFELAPTLTAGLRIGYRF